MPHTILFELLYYSIQRSRNRAKLTHKMQEIQGPEFFKRKKKTFRFPEKEKHSFLEKKNNEAF